MNIKRLSYLEPPPKVPKRLLALCENYLSKVVCVRLADWKRIASNPLDQFDENELITNELTDALKRARDAENVSAQYRQLKGFESGRSQGRSSPVPGTSTQEESNDTSHCHCYGVVRSKTAESTFSGISANDTFIEETSYTDHLIQTKGNETSVIHRQENINQSFQEDDSDNPDTHSSVAYAETSFSTGMAERRFSRNRLSYRRAIRFGQTYTSVIQPKSDSKSTTIMENVSTKYQWYFVADVLDTVTFLIYLIVMFVGILTVLVIAPLYA